jgi:hypothetical protein
VHHVVPPLHECLTEVRLNADRDAELRTARDRYRRSDGDHVGRFAARERPAAGEQVGGTRRGREHSHRVTE